MKKFISMFTVAMFAVVALVACGSEEPKTEQPSTNETTNESTNESTTETKIRVGMMTDSGTIDDKSFNQGTWEGIKKYESDKGVDVKYVQPSGETTQDYLTANDNLVAAGYNVIVAPGFKFEEAIGEAQNANTDVKYILIDGTPLVGEEYVVADNTVSIFFAEEEAGFLAGVAAALQSETGKVGFIGGMKIPAVEKFGWGFVSGVAYANANLGTSVEVADYVYQGTFYEVAAGQTLAGGMYDKGIDIIFAAAGGVGVGVINEAKVRAEKGDNVFVVGVDVDQYADGIITDGSSVILTSAVKKLGVAAYDYIDAVANGTFPGGQTIIMNAENDGIGLPDENPNLTEETVAKTDEVFAAIKAGTIKAATSTEELEALLAEYGYDASSLIQIWE